MIVKIPEQRQFPNSTPETQQSFDDLVEYLLEQFGLDRTKGFLRDRYSLETHQDQLLPGFTDLLTYAAAPTGPVTDDILSPNLAGEKCLAVELHRVTHLNTAISEMNAVAARNKAVKDAAYHFILSWPEHEKPEHENIFDAARHALRALNLQDHQYMLAIHGNTDNWHCHVAVNRVNPDTFKSPNISFAIRTLHRAARESEIKHGWSHDNGIYVVDIDENGNKTIVKNPEIDIYSKDTYATGQSSASRTPGKDHRAARLESGTRTAASPWTDPDSLINWARSTVAPKLKSALPVMTNWSDLHQFLAQQGLELKDTGGGGMRLTALDRATGEVLDIAASKALRILKRADLEARWGAYQASTYPINITETRSPTRAKNLTNFDRFDRFGPHPETTTRRERVRELFSEHVVRDENGTAVLLPRDAPDHMEHTEADFDTSVRRGSDGGRSLVASPDNDAPTDPRWTVKRLAAKLITDKLHTGPVTRDPFDWGSSKRDPLKRAQRKEERAEERIALRRRYQLYKESIAASKPAHAGRKKELRAAQRAERDAQIKSFAAAKQLLKEGKLAQLKGLTLRDADTLTEHYEQEYFITAALLASNHAVAKLAMAAQHRNQHQEMSLHRLPALPWRDWLLAQAQEGDQPALSALRGIVYQARRDAKITSDSPTVAATKAPFPAGTLPTGLLTTDDHATVDFLAVVAKLREDEKRECAIRSGNECQARPYQCDALIVQAANMTYRVTGNGNVQFFDRKDDRHLFTDRGNRLTFDKKTVSDDELRLALLHAKEKFGNRLTLTGEDPIFTARMARIADDLGIQILNPEMVPVIAAHRADRLRSKVALPLSPSASMESPSSAIPPVTTEESPAERDKLNSPASVPVNPERTHAEPNLPQPELTESLASKLPPIVPIITAADELTAAQLAPGTSPTLQIPAETLYERLRQEVLAAHPRGTLITANPRTGSVYIGTIVAKNAEAFVQRTGRNSFTMHPHAPPSNLPEVGKVRSNITYQDRKPVCIPLLRGENKKGGR